MIFNKNYHINHRLIATQMETTGACGMQYINKCPNKYNKVYCVNTTSYYRNQGFEKYFCSEDCMDRFSKYHRCQTCGYDGDLTISEKDNLSYCTSKGYLDQSCHEAHMGIPGTCETNIRPFVDRFTEMVHENKNDNNNFSLNELKLIKEYIDEILNKKIKELE